MKKTYSILTLSLFVSICFSQTIQGTDVNPLDGDIQEYSVFNYTSPGTAGADQIWDFSGVNSTSEVTNNVSTSTLNGSNIKLANPTAEVHMKVDNSAQETLVAVNPVDGQTITYSDGEKTLQFPFTLNASYADNFTASFLYGGFFPGTRSGSNSILVDGTGTLKLPNATIEDVVRIKLTQSYSDVIDISGTPLVIVYTSENYSWFKAGTRFALCSLSELFINGSKSSFGLHEKIEPSVGIYEVEGVNSLSVIQNPFNEKLDIVIESTLNDKKINYSLVDLSGQIVYNSGVTTLATGENNISISTSNLAKGMYVLKLTSSSGEIKTKLLVKQ